MLLASEEEGIGFEFRSGRECCGRILQFCRGGVCVDVELLDEIPIPSGQLSAFVFSFSPGREASRFIGDPISFNSPKWTNIPLPLLPSSNKEFRIAQRTL